MVLQCDGDPRLIDDLVKGTILCRNMTEIKSVWETLNAIRMEGAVAIMNIKNGFRGPPDPGGYRVLTVSITFREVPCELQVGDFDLCTVNLTPT